LAAEKFSVRLDWSPHGLQSAFHLAAEKGWFTDQGLDVSIEDGNGSATCVQLVGAGQVDIGFAALGPMALGAAKGLPVTSIAGFVQFGDTGVLVPEGSGWTKPQDLIGKKIDYTAGSLEGPFMVPFFKKNGISQDQVELLNVDATAKFSVYISGKSDAMVSTVPFLLPFLADKRASKGILFADFGLNLPGSGLVVKRDLLAARGPAVKTFCSVICGTYTYILNGHVEEAAAATLKARPAAPPVKTMVAEIEGYRPYFQTAATKGLPIGVQALKDWQGVVADMSGAGTIPADSKPESFFTNDYIDVDLVKKIGSIA
jgi:NitT/TauT family transport system substrate-binding protein